MTSEKPARQVRVGDEILVDAGKLTERKVTVTATGTAIACGRGPHGRVSHQLVTIDFDEADGQTRTKLVSATTPVRLPEEEPDEPRAEGADSERPAG